MTETFKPWGNHGPEPCEGCGQWHTPVWLVYDDEGYPLVDLNEPQWREVRLHSLTEDGTPLYVEVTEEEHNGRRSV